MLANLDVELQLVRQALREFELSLRTHRGLKYLEILLLSPRPVKYTAR